MLKSILYSFSRTFGRILCYLFIGFIISLLFTCLKGDFNLWENLKNYISILL